MKEPVSEVIYVMGTARSGSTILGIILAQSDQILYAGELAHVFRDGLVANNPCSCGMCASDCGFWSRVWSQAGWTRESGKKWANILSQVEHHRSFPKLLVHGVSAQVWHTYKKVNNDLFASIGRVSGKAVILDTSKYAGRALALARSCPGRLRIICLTRSARGVMDAFQKRNVEQRGKRPLSAAAYYLYVLSCLRSVKGALAEDILFLSFDDLLENPQAILSRIEDWSGQDLTRSHEAIARGAELAGGHLLTGNRIRKSESLYFQPRRPPLGAVSMPTQVLVRMMNGYRRTLGLE